MITIIIIDSFVLTPMVFSDETKGDDFALSTDILTFHGLYVHLEGIETLFLNY
jgi:hypothetical protein